MKRRLTVILVCVLGLITGIAINYQHLLPNSFERHQDIQSSTNTIIAMANWGEIAYTTEELYQSADIIVRGQVVATHNRMFTETLQIQGLPDHLVERAKEVSISTLTLEEGMRQRGIEGTPEDLTEEQKRTLLDETIIDTQTIGEETYYAPYTDTTIEITEVLKGNAAKTIMVSQIGGTMQTPHHTEATTLEFPDNPALQTDDEYILFLTHQEDPHPQIDTKGLERYILTGPTGQFRINGDNVTNTGDAHAAATVDGEQLNKLPTDLNTLLAEIQQLSETP